MVSLISFNVFGVDDCSCLNWPRFRVDCPVGEMPIQDDIVPQSSTLASSRDGGCYQNEIVYRRTCLSIGDQTSAKYRVQHTEGLSVYPPTADLFSLILGGRLCSSREAQFGTIVWLFV